MKLNKEFWIGHIFTIIATVLGVYLAATSGYKLAIEFENSKSKKDTFYVAQALYGEAKQNADNMLAWGTKFKTVQDAGFEMRRKRQDYVLNTFVWQTMKESPNTFEIPFQYLGKIQNYYMFSANQMNKMLDSPMTKNFATPLIENSESIKIMLDEYKQYLDKEKQELLDLGFTL